MRPRTPVEPIRNGRRSAYLEPNPGLLRGGLVVRVARVCAWLRFYGLSAAAQAQPARSARRPLPPLPPSSTLLLFLFHNPRLTLGPLPLRCLVQPQQPVPLLLSHQWLCQTGPPALS